MNHVGRRRRRDRRALRAVLAVACTASERQNFKFHVEQLEEARL